MEELKIEDRKAFNFFRSYWNVGKMLPDDERLAFYDAVIKMQFTKEQTKLTGIAELAYVSQKHNIDNQINGYEKVGLRTKTVTPNDGASLGATDGASVQVQVQVQGKEQEQDIVKEKKKPIKKAVAFDFSFVANNFSECFMKWIDYKNELKQAYKSQTSLQTCYNNLLKLSAGNPTKAMHVVNQSIGNGWAGLFEFKGQIEPEDKTDMFFINGEWRKKTPTQKYH